MDIEQLKQTNYLLHTLDQRGGVWLKTAGNGTPLILTGVPWPAVVYKKGCVCKGV